MKQCKVSSVKCKVSKVIKHLTLHTLHLTLILHFTLYTIFTGCGKKSSKSAQQTSQSMPKPKLKMPEYVPPPPPKKYTYIGNKYRDPLMPEGGGAEYTAMGTAGAGAETGSMTGDKLATLYLKGIFSDEKTGGIAFISDTAGNSYTFKNRKLYDKKRKIVEGVAGVIKKDSVMLFCKDTKVELKLKKTGEEKKK